MAKPPPYFMVKALYFMVGTPPFPVLNLLLQVATRLQDFESQITAQLSNLQTDFARGLGTVFSGSRRFWGGSFNMFQMFIICNALYIYIHIQYNTYIYIYTMHIYNHIYIIIIMIIIIYIYIMCMCYDILDVPDLFTLVTGKTSEQSFRAPATLGQHTATLWSMVHWYHFEP